MSLKNDDEQRNTASTPAKLVDLLKKYGLYIAIGVVIICIAVLLIIIAGHSGQTAGQETESETGALIVNTDVQTGAATAGTTGVNVLGLEANQYPEITELIEQYFTALLDGDVDTLNKIVESDHILTEDDLSNSGEYIEAYKNINTYALDGLLENTYIVYVYYEVKLLNIETAAPSLVRMYVCRNEDDSVYVYNSNMSDEMTAYAQQMDNNEDVRILVAEVNEKLRKACEEDEDLNDFYNKILNEDKDETELESESELESGTEINTDTETKTVTQSETETEIVTESETKSAEATDEA